MDAPLNPGHPSSSSGLSPEILLERMERVRALAGQLVRQAADRDDLVQEAVVRALAHPQVLTGDPEPWLRRVLKNLVIDRARSNQRRERREHDAQPTETVATSTVDAVSRAEKQRDLVDAVLSLKDPYRTVLLRRYFDGEPPRRIAEELDVAVPTVKKQLERGMALVRKRLEGRYGDQGAWAVALLPILPQSALDALKKAVIPTATSGALAAWSWPVAVGGGGLVAAATLVIVHGLGDQPGELAPRIVGVPENTSEVASAGPQTEDPPRAQPVPRSAAVDSESAADVGTAKRTYEVTFVNENAEPMEGVELHLAAGSDSGLRFERAMKLGESSSAGGLSALLPDRLPEAPVLIASAEGFALATLRIPADAGSAISGGTQILHRPAELRVRVVDADGELLNGWTAGYFQAGPNGRLDSGRAFVEPSRGFALFSEIAAAPVEISATHPSGARVDHPRRSLAPGPDNAVDLVYAGPDPARRIGLEISFPPIASALAKGAPVDVTVERGAALVAERQAALSGGEIAFENLGDASSTYTVGIDDPRFNPVTLEVAAGTSEAISLRGSASIELSLRTKRGAPLRITRAYALGGRRVSLELTGGGATTQRLDNLIPGEPIHLWLEGNDQSHAAVLVDALDPGEVRRLDIESYEGVRKQVVRAVREINGARAPAALAPVGLFVGTFAPGSREERQAIAWLRGERRDAEPPSLVFSALTDRAGELRIPVAEDAPSTSSPLPWTILSAEGVGERLTPATRRGTIVLRLRTVGSCEARVTGHLGPLPAGVGLTLKRSRASVSAARDPEDGWKLKAAEDSANDEEPAVLRFTADNVPVGQAELWLAYTELNLAGRGTPLGSPTGTLGFVLGEVAIRSDQAASIEARLDGCLPGAVSLTVLRDGSALRDAVVELEPTEETAAKLRPLRGGPARRIAIARLTDGAGRVRFSRVPPGAWRVRVREAGWLWAALANTIEVTAEAQAQAAISVALREGVVQISSAAAPTTLWIELAP
ncbi:MAG: sigma-70 family RNA polymerase sigma factor, partial [Planctomycetota bacterium]